jgi:hypothetical protein
VDFVWSIPGVRFSIGNGDSACGLKAGRWESEVVESEFWRRSAAREVTKPMGGPGGRLFGAGVLTSVVGLGGAWFT